MGLILLPLLLFWIVVGFFSLKMGYGLIQQESDLYILAFGLLSLLIAFFYLKHGFDQFKRKSELGMFDIPFYFLIRVPMFLCALLGLLFYLFGQGYFINQLLHAGLIIAMFVGAVGAIVATFISERFINKNNIKKVF